jgi:serine/threonine protein kinase
MLGEYRLIERLGEGGMGVVHLAISPDDTLVAVKVLRPSLVDSADGKARFEREVATLKRVSGPRIAAVLDADVTHDPPYIVTEYVRGQTLDELVADHGPLRGAALKRLAEGLASAIEAIHDVDVIHRDIKPGNVMMTGDGPVLIDFGIAKAVDDTALTRTGMQVGTPRYMSPEVLTGRHASDLSDVHAWAGTVAFAATGRPPFGAGEYETLRARICSGDADLADVPEGLAGVLEAAFETNPDERPDSIDLSEMLDELTDLDYAPPVVQTEQWSPEHEEVDALPVVPTAVAVPEPVPDLTPYPEPVADFVGAPSWLDSLVRPHPPPPLPSTRPMLADTEFKVRTWPARIAVTLLWLLLLATYTTSFRAGTVALIVAVTITRFAWWLRCDQFRSSADPWVSGVRVAQRLLIELLVGVLHLAALSALVILVLLYLGLDDGPNIEVPYVLLALGVMILLWIGPATHRIRNGTRVLAHRLDRNWRAAWIVSGVAAAAMWIILAIGEAADLDWERLEPGVREFIENLDD